MALTPGARLGPYEIVSALGAGGMGEVYRATDTKLKRQVAVKILPTALAADLGRLARFQREAEVLASLNHPNIAAIHGLEDADGVTALVMELVEGEDLARRISRGPIPLDEALPIAKQIAEALEAAHEQGIIHRDLKPANIKLRPDGTVKVLDFGLAKALAPGSAPAVHLSQSPTITSPAMMTGVGMILGTAAYMSPEQAKGKSADKRSDIWAFGCVLYEMLTGESPFARESVTETLAAVLNEEPSWPRAPARTERLLRACLEKDPRRRLRDIGDAFRLLDERPPSAQRTSWVPFAAAGALALLLAISLWALWRSSEIPSQPTLAADIDLGADVDLSSVGSNMILAPDASRLIVVSVGEDGTRRLFRRNLDSSRAEPLPGTEGAYFPFFSPDGRWVGFFAGGKLKKTAVDGGQVYTLCDAPAGRGGSWSEDNSIVAALDTRVGLSLIPSAGGPPVPLTELSSERRELSHRLPHFLPGGRAVLFTASAAPSNYSAANIAVVSLADRQVKILLEGVGSDGRYITSGHLVYVSAGRLSAVSFDTARLEVRGNPTTVLEGVASSGSITGTAQLDFSLNGHMVYQRGAGLGMTTLQWVDETGKTELALSEPADYQFPALSPDGNLLAVTTEGDIWVHDWRQGRRTRLTTGSTRSNHVPVWTPDGRSVVFRAIGGIYWTRADGAGQPQPLIESKNFLSPLALSPDGKTLAYSENSGTGLHLLMVPLEAGPDGLRAGKPELYVEVPSSATLAAFSPDGRWLAYASAKSGIYEVYVRAFPDTGSERLVSGGGHMPVWSRNGHELFYRTEYGHIMVVTYTVKGDSFVADKPRVWSPRRLAYASLNRNFDLAPDGRFVAAMPTEGRELPNHALLVVNFFEELQRRLEGDGK